MFVFSCSPSCSSSPAWLSVELEASSHLWVERVLSSSISVRGVAWNCLFLIRVTFLFSYLAHSGSTNFYKASGNTRSQLIAPRKARTNICSSEKRCLESKKIFGIYMVKNEAKVSVEDAMQPGNQMLAASYCMYGSSCTSRIYVIGIDEAQFFDDLYEFCRKAADDDGKTVIVSGLDGNT
ncbi:hypothetical protein LR48_Vigan05g181300 [Vigna angularis]|uniref:Thymidine kinase n=1 Tax=Phaseolus angularis TaxID=3914 RepID=A0A0L9UN71_PHAAN|nr:hypothetical protein LR48_Vigan05g181300 [Vigna angularis]